MRLCGSLKSSQQTCFCSHRTNVMLVCRWVMSGSERLHRDVSYSHMTLPHADKGRHKTIIKVLMETLIKQSMYSIRTVDTAEILPPSLCLVLLRYSFARWNFKHRPLIRLRVLFISSSWMHITSLRLTLRLVEEARGTKTKTSAASHVFLPCCWYAPAMPTAPISLLISFSTFVPHQYSDVVHEHGLGEVYHFMKHDCV